MIFEKKIKELKKRRRRATVWGFAIPFALLFTTGGSLLIASLGGIFFSAIARTLITEELEEINKTIYLGGKKYGRH
jgi:hypothetical protein